MLWRGTLALLLAALLAGCSDPPAGAGGDGDGDGPGTGDDDTLPTTDAAAPSWRVGQWWEWETSFGTETRPETFRSVVAGTGSGYVLASDLDGMAKEEAAFGHPFLGDVSADLGMDGFGGAWDLLDFPLTDGKTWQATVPNIAWDVLLPAETADLAMTATYDAALPGYRLMGHIEQGMVLEATYLPATGWFGELLVHDLDPGQEEVQVALRAVAAGLNHTGPVYTATAEPLLVLQDGSGLDAPPPQGQPFVQPQPSGSFTMADGTVLYGVLFAETVMGGRVITLTDPAGNQRQVVSNGDLDGDQQQLFLDEAGVAGAWQLVTSGAGGYTFAYVELHEITVTETTL